MLKTSLLAQNTDSLKYALELSVNENHKLDILKTLGQAYFNQNFDSSLFYFNEYLNQAVRLNRKKEILEAKYRLAQLYVQLNNKTQAKDLLSSIIKADGVNDTLKADYYRLMGEMYEKQFQVDSAIYYLDKAFQIQEKMGPVYMIGTISALAFVHKSVKNFPTALHYFKKQSELFDAVGRSNEKKKSFINTGLIYTHLGNAEPHYYDSAIYFYELAFELIGEEELYGKAIYYNNMADVLCLKAQYKQAVEYAKEAIEIKEKLGDPVSLANSYNVLAESSIGMGHHQEAKKYASIAFDLVDSLDAKHQQYKALKYLLEAKAALNETEQLWPLIKQLDEVKSAISAAQQSEYFAEMSAKFETEQKEKENQILRLESKLASESLLFQRKINYWLTGTALVLLLSLLLILRINKLRKQANHLLSLEKETVTEQSKKLTKLNEIKSQFFATISHELRTPLALIQAHTDQAKENQKLPLSTLKQLEGIKKSVSQLTLLVNDLLDLSKLELNRYELELKNLDINKINQRIVASFSSLAESKGINLSYDSKVTNQALALIDPVQYEKVLNNLIYNAFKFTPHKGKISIETHDAESHWEIRIIDNGVGISEEELPYIFDRFYQASNNFINEHGTGLGLSIAKDLIEKMSGQIKVTSEANHGSIFSIILPKSNQDLEEDTVENREDLVNVDLYSTASTENLLDKLAYKYRLLIVEDNQDLQHYLKDVLTGHFQIELAANGKLAWELLKRKEPPHLVITDVMMPEMDGFELINAMKKEAALSHIPVIILTALASNEDKLRGLRLGVDDYLTKPFEAEELKIRVINQLQNLENRIKWVNEFGQDDYSNESKLLDNDFIIQFRDFVMAQIDDKNLGIPAIAEELAVSERQLYRKITAATGMTPAKLVNELKLQYARELLTVGKIRNLKEVSISIGIDSTAYFSKLFFNRFGKKPSDMIGYYDN